jgi:hypothetical protein
VEFRRQVELERPIVGKSSDALEGVFDERRRLDESQGCGMRSTVGEEALNELVETFHLLLYFLEEVTPRFFLPLHVGSTQAADEPLDVAQR